ncbi:MAG: 3'-5' exonuclease [Cytophagales bacterium]|nr:3'-5' exonuclease [Cytophagales bacterium]
MKLNLKNPLAFFDLEATGTNVIHDRIVEVAIVQLMPNGERTTFTKKVNPTIPIPPESSLLHGIYDEDVKDAPTFKMIAKSLAKFLEGCDLAGFNILRFDIPMLVEEFLRAKVDFKTAHRKLIDTQKIFHLMEKRNLSSAYQFYCNKTLAGAHSAMVDTLATVEILEAQVARYEGATVTDISGNKVGTIKNDMKKLHELTTSTMIDFAGRMTYNEEGREVFNFGKHKNKLVSQVLKDEPTYYDWMMQSDFPLDTKRKLTQIKLKYR